MSTNTDQDWKTSLAHLELLSKFIKPLPLYYIPDSYRGPSWYEALKESSLSVIRRFIEAGYLVRPNLYALMEYKFKIPDLKRLCADRNLPVSGKKSDLINRLILADMVSMQTEVDDLQIFVCSDQGKPLAQAHLEMRKQEREEAESMVIESLKKRDFSQAKRVVAKYEANQVFPRGLGIDWDRESLLTNPRDIYILKSIFEDLPTVAKGLDPQVIDQFRLAAGVMHLWGSDKIAKSLLEGFGELSNKFENIDFARMLWSSAVNKVELIEYRELANSLGEKKYKVEIDTANDEYVCDACKKLAKKKYPLFSDVPELPHPGCTHACRCGYNLDMGY